MKAQAIVYTSNTGYTAKYAKLLSQRTGLPVYDLHTALRDLPHARRVVYLGWLRAGTVVGLRRAAAAWPVEAVCAVGQGAADSDQAAPLRGKFPAAFYLRGGYDYSRLTGIDRTLMWGMTQFMALRAKKDPQAAAMLEQLKRGGDWVDPAALDAVAEFLEK